MLSSVLALTLVLAAGSQEAYGTLEFERSAFCGDGRTPEIPKETGNYLVAVPRKEGGSLCTAIIVARPLKGAENAGLQEWQISLGGGALIAEDGFFVAIEPIGSDGKVTGKRLFAYPDAQSTGNTVRASLTLSANSPGSAVRILVGAQRGLDITVTGISVVPVSEAISLERLDQINSIVSIVRKNALSMGAGIEWSDVEKVLVNAGARAPQNSTSVLIDARNLLSITGLSHSFAFTNEAYINFSGGKVAGGGCPEPLKPKTVSTSGGRKLLVELSPYMGDASCVPAFVSTSTKTLADVLSSEDYEGVIVDLRGNTGGNMWPMLAVISPFLSSGKLIGMAEGQARATEWVTLSDGILASNGMAVFPEGTVLGERSSLPVEVYICDSTASSGEAVALALKASGARLLGRSTRGLTTSNRAFELPEGVTLMLTTAKVVLPDGSYSSKVVPDVEMDEAFCTLNTVAVGPR